MADDDEINWKPGEIHRVMPEQPGHIAEYSAPRDPAERIEVLYVDHIPIKWKLDSSLSVHVVLTLLAGEDVTIFGKPARIIVEWPDGPPLYETPRQVKEWAARELAKLRGHVLHPAGDISDGSETG